MGHCFVFLFERMRSKIRSGRCGGLYFCSSLGQVEMRSTANDVVPYPRPALRCHWTRTHDSKRKMQRMVCLRTPMAGMVETRTSVNDTDSHALPDQTKLLVLKTQGELLLEADSFTPQSSDRGKSRRLFHPFLDLTD